MLGVFERKEVEYTTERNARGGYRFNVQNLPNEGDKLILTDASVVTFDGIGMAGMLECTDCNGIQSLLFTHPIDRPFVEANPFGGDADLTHL